MTRFIHDQFAKDYLEELLKPYGEVQAASQVAGEIREIDVLFTPFPNQTTNVELLGLLGTLATTPAIFEPFRNPASTEEICDCLLKSLEVRGALRRAAKREQTNKTKIKIPKLWILTPTASLKGTTTASSTASLRSQLIRPGKDKRKEKTVSKMF